ncbi:hypothetical protein EG328_005614 [Venturia inaequalis]|uniref:Mid2 domain-containing protein n=1 Tax=Venturia inaequalis TaxID=5025 RepID=A0A8H3VGZ6_VENIN|nr:hypothetical protein EG328_005614 [Venturia inaequalis]KAE9992579.1 hypothetical protein EG327_008593 [Venturia inaequalis]
MLLTIALLFFTFGIACIAARAGWYSPEPFSASSLQTEIWYEREIKELRWDADMDDYGIYLTQGKQNNPLGDWVCIYRQSYETHSSLQELRLTILPSDKQKNNTSQSRMLWAVQSFPSFDLGLINSFWLQINDNKGTFRTTNSFSIQNATRNATSTCPSNNTTTTPGSGPNKARMVGIGLGVGLGLPLLLTLASLAFLLISSRRVKRDGLPETKLGVETTMEEPKKDAYHHQEASGLNEVYEISNHDVVHEAPVGNPVPYR